MLFTLTYVSYESRPMKPIELDVLARQSARHNLRSAITGVLLYADGYFMQRLEGPREAVLDLLGRIRHDDRHEVLMVTDVRSLERRTFEAWGMALLDARTFDAAQEEQQALLVSLPETVRDHPGAVEDVALLMRAMLAEAA